MGTSTSRREGLEVPRNAVVPQPLSAIQRRNSLSYSKLLSRIQSGPATIAVRSSSDGNDGGGRQMRWMTGENRTAWPNRTMAMSCRCERGSYCWWTIIFSTLYRLLPLLFSSNNVPLELLFGWVELVGNLPGMSNSPNLMWSLDGCTLVFSYCIC